MTSKLFVDFKTPIDAAWLNDVNSVTYATIYQDVFTATAGQTAFSLTKTPSTFLIVQVFVNGLRYTPTLDYTITTNVLTFGSGLSLSDEVLVEYYA